MRPVNIYALTRVEKPGLLSRLERQMSLRRRFLHVKQWEIVSLKAFCDHVTDCASNAVLFDFYYSFQIPKLGKEFDLLRISDDMVVNVELKSFPVGDDSVKKQLIQNRYYLSTLGKTIRSYTYISSEDRLVRLTNGGRLIEEKFENLCNDLMSQKDCFEGNIEELFKEERYIISPLADPDRFLMSEYFLTSQQVDIKKHILKRIRSYKSTDSKDGICAQGFTGLPGTGKTLLLYDIAMELSVRQRVCIIHCGSFSTELKKLDERLKRIDFFQCNGDEKFNENDLYDYSVCLVDEAHRLDNSLLDMVIDVAHHNNTPVIFSYDCEDIISKEEMDKSILQRMEGIEGFTSFRLTNRIRTKSELSSFIQAIITGPSNNHRKDYPSVTLEYSNSEEETDNLLNNLMKKGYIYIYDPSLMDSERITRYDKDRLIDIGEVSFKEFDRVVIYINSRFNYNKSDGLRSVHDEDNGEGSCVRNMFHGLNRAKSKIAIVVENNEDVFEGFLYIAQGKIR